MNRKVLLLILIVFLASIAAVSAEANDTAVRMSDGDVLEKTSYYDADKNKFYDDDTVITHDVAKYYGDNDKKFTVKVFDKNHKPLEGVSVSLIKEGKYKIKKTDSNGIVNFPINYNVGTYDVETYIEQDGGSFWSAYNKVKVKSTIPSEEIVKYSTSKKKFEIKFLDTKGKPLKNKVVSLKIDSKKYKLKTNSKGVVKIKSNNFKVGVSKITVYNSVSKETRKIPVVILKKGLHKINIRIDDPTKFFPTKKLKNGDRISTVYETKYRQYDPGVYVEAYHSGMDGAKHTKLVKAKFFFKNKKTGKVISKTSSKVKYNNIVLKPIKGYSPFKAAVWYKDKK